MQFSLFDLSRKQAVIELFTKVFTASESGSEGELIGNLVADLVDTTPPGDLLGCVATSGDDMLGCIFFSRLLVPGGQVAFLLSPVAVATAVQGRGIGQKLINYGLGQLRSLGVSFVFPYGDPDFYTRTGFRRISEQQVQAPFRLSRPEGWLAQALDGNPVKVLQGVTGCVEALNDQRYW